MCIRDRCSTCDRVFKTWQAYQSHIAQAHNIRSPIQLRILDNVCPCCDKKWPYRYNNVLHVRQTAKCREYVMNVPPFSFEQVKPLIDSDNKIIKANRSSGLPPLYSHSK